MKRVLFLTMAAFAAVAIAQDPIKINDTDRVNLMQVQRSIDKVQVTLAQLQAQFAQAQLQLNQLNSVYANMVEKLKADKKCLDCTLNDELNLVKPKVEEKK